MDFTLSSSESAFLEEFREWLTAHHPGEAPVPGSERTAFLRQWQRTLHEGRWIGLNYPDQYGGRPAGVVEMMLFYQELARQRAPEIIGVVNARMLGPVLLAFGTDEQKERYIRPALSADEMWCQGFSEPGAGSDLSSLRTQGAIEGDRLRISGQKIWTTLAHVADMIFMLVRTDPTSERSRGMSMVLVPMDAPGVTVRPLRQITGDAEFNEVFFDDVVVSVDDVVGGRSGLGRGWEAASATLGFERGTTFFGTQIRWQRTIEELREMAARVGRAGDERIAGLQIDLDAMRYLSLRSLSATVRGGQPGPESSVLKLLRGRFEQRMYKLATDLQAASGGLTRTSPGVLDGGRWQYRYMSSRAATIAAGTTEVQYNIIASRILDLPKGR